MDILALSNYIIRQFSQQSPDGITPMKLQKLLYYIKVWTTVAGQKLVPENFEHWDYGPVNREVYEFYKEYGKSVIDPNQSENVYINETEKTLVDFIVENYVEFDAFTLSAMTHSEKPWRNTERNDLISDELIKSYYGEQYFAKNFQPFDLSSNSFYPLDNHSFTIDMTEKDAREITKYSSYEDYKLASSDAEKDFDAEWSSLIVS
ncbi:MAG: type II toxin-antitoxin system antitoxin SocA domain-containing protein [Thermosynechococcaceae cyanobacterium]